MKVQPADSSNNTMNMQETTRVQQAAAAKLEKILKGSAVRDRTEDFPQFVRSEVTVGKLLGTGGFGAVYEVKAFSSSVSTPKSDKDASSVFSLSEEAEDYLGMPLSDSRHVASRKFLADHCLRNNSDCRYAIKVLKPEIMKDEKLYVQALTDVAIETRVLSDIFHPNIVKLRAVAQGSPLDGPSFFIIMDRLYDTLEQRIQVWAKKTKKWSSGLAKSLRPAKADQKQRLLERAKFKAAFDLAAAVQYLHDRRMIYRDLKSENVGFDVRDDVKLFDFGLVKELTGLTPNEDGLYHLTGKTGSFAYMAPEVAQNKPYNKSCDTFSFAMLFWEMYSMKTPFELYKVRHLKEADKAMPHALPVVPNYWPKVVQELLKASWDFNPTKRPSCDAVSQILRAECVRLGGGDESGLEHLTRRSTFVFEEEDVETMNALIEVQASFEAGDLGNSERQLVSVPVS